MIHKVLAVFDSKAQAFATPFYVANIQIGMRAFHAAANDNSLLVGKYPADYSLFALGEWDDETALFTPEQAPINLGLAATYRTPTVEQSEPYQAATAQLAN